MTKTRDHTKGRLAGTMAALFAGATVLQAQNYAPLAVGAQGSTYATDTSYSGESTMSKDNAGLGEIHTLQQSFTYLYSHQVTERFRWEVGAVGESFSFGARDNSLVPERLASIATRIGGNWKFSENWSGQFSIQSGLYSDFEDIDGGDINALFGLGAVYSAGPDFQAVFGLSLNPRGKYPVLGGVGVRWRFAYNWNLLLLPPKARVEYTFTDRLTGYVGAELLGGTFRVAKDFGASAGRPDLGDQDVDYREIRVGVGVRHHFNPAISLGIETGWMIDRRFDFDDRNLVLDGEGAPYVRLAIGGRF